ncbi:response regulator [Rhodocaloribacter litoris]|uniref:T9SS response regulator signal transducer PorX n=1 Tax=Rhodocaloribacter litoris TaxID=2558931 RepID=UPI00141EDD6F|nr:response regulator [Rhodocaloribacter litoris]QXD13859.1 response regulator [Rhodocaloribacter litoris]
MTQPLSRILWADDEIDLLRPHILFLESKGYDVTSVTNGTDAVEKVKAGRYDVVLLDEQMPGMGGLETLSRIKDLAPEVPVVMVTKSEEEHLMEEALGGQISDYLTKPVNPSQVLLTCKRLLERARLRSERASQAYLQAFGEITRMLMNPLSHAEWVELYLKLVRYDLELEGDENVRQVLDDQFREANRAFGRYIEEVYAGWIARCDEAPDEHRPVLSHEVVPRFVFPALDEKRPVLFFVIDCMRYDQWLEFEKLLYPLFEIEKDFHYSILPTATPYARNAVFSGLLPRDIARRYPKIWEGGEDDEHSRNRYEEPFLRDLLERKRRKHVRLRYEKLIGSQDGREFAARVSEYPQNDLSAIVVNFVDILAHSRSDSDVLKEIAPDERAYRALTRTWFEHSWLYQAFQELAGIDCTLVVTTDHGAIRSLHATKVIGDRETSTALRYKYGRNLKCDERHAIFVRDPRDFGLPAPGINTNYIIAKEDYYFVYPTNYHHYLNLYRDTMQHGGASMQEMILPVVTMRPKR